MHRRLDVGLRAWRLRTPLRIAARTIETALLCQVEVRQGDHVGRGEAAGVWYRGDDPEGLPARIEAVRAAIEAGATREDLMGLLPPGGARNALDCALWDLEAQIAGRPVWSLAGLPPPMGRPTAMTLGADAPEAMAAAAAGLPGWPILKLKLIGDGVDGARVEAVRAARPHARLVVDANQGFRRASLLEALPALEAAGVSLIEQPVPVGHDAELEGVVTRIPFAADESVQDVDDLALAQGRYQVINIKLDKCGGLTAALRLQREAARRGFRTMVGNMLGTSRAMAPALLLAGRAELLDLDGPLWLAEDVAPAMRYRDGFIQPVPGGWGEGGSDPA